MGEKRKAPKGCYWRRDTLWARFEVNGKEIRRSLHTDDGAIAEGRLKALRQKETAAARYGDERASWEDAVNSWSTVIGSHTRPNTVKRYAVSLKQLEPFLIGLYVDEIDRKVVADIVRRRRMAEVTNATIRRDLGALSSVLAHCEEEEWREGNPALDKLRRIKERRDAIVLPQPAHIEAVIARAPGNFSALIKAAWLTGCRQDELRTLTHPNLDFKRGQMTVTGKGGKTRVIDMNDVRPVLEKLPRVLRSKVVFWHSEGEPYLNISSNFRRLVAAEMAARIKAAKAARAAQKSAQPIEVDFRAFRFHDLRHLFAVESLRRGESLYALQKHLGHTSIKTTEIYLDHLTASEAAAAKAGSAQNPDHEQRFTAQIEDLSS